MITDVFVEGARKGWNIGAMSTIPNVMMAFIIIKALNITGALGALGSLFEPLMILVGLPGEWRCGYHGVRSCPWAVRWVS